MLLEAALPITKMISKVGVTRRIDDVQYLLLKKDIMPGDVFVTSKRFELSSIFIPGEFSHVALYLGEDILIEAVAKGVAYTSLPYFCFSKDRIAVMRPLFITGQDRVKIESKKYIGIPYDFYFEKTVEAFYCSELVYTILKHFNGFEQFTLRKTLGVETVTPDDFFRAKKYFSLVTDTGA